MVAARLPAATGLPNGYVDIVRNDVVARGEGLYGPRMLAFVTPVAVEVDRSEDVDYLAFLIETRGHLLHEGLKTRRPSLTEVGTPPRDR